MISPSKSLDLKNEARLRVQLEGEVKADNAYKTLFYGLKRNHEHNVAIV